MPEARKPYDKTYAGNCSLALCRTTLSVTHPLFSCSLVHSDGFRNTRYNFTNAFIYIDSFDNCLVAKEKKSKSNDTLVVVVRLEGADIFLYFKEIDLLFLLFKMYFVSDLSSQHLE